MTIDRDFRQVLAELELLSHGKTAALNSSGAGENTAVLPYGETRPPHEYWRARYAAAAETDRAGILEHARRELDIWKKRQAPAEDTWDEKDAILKDGEGFSAADVARRFQRSVTYVMKLRDDAKDPRREPQFGMPIDMSPVKDNSRERVLNLAAQGCTLRQIEMQTGKPRETVRRWLKEAA